MTSWFCVAFRCLCLVFFFFKQKTAYEMRISDWSSDVCSSDLRRVTATIEAQGDPGSGNRVRLIGYDTLLEEEHYQGFPLEFFSVPGHLVTSLNGENLEGTFRAFIHAPFKQDEMVGDRNNTSLVLQVEIGRASCGERVCKYV